MVRKWNVLLNCIVDIGLLKLWLQKFDDVTRVRSPVSVTLAENELENGRVMALLQLIIA